MERVRRADRRLLIARPPAGMRGRATIFTAHRNGNGDDLGHSCLPFGEAKGGVYTAEVMR